MGQTLTGVKAPPVGPVYVDAAMSKKTVTLDVREDLRRGREPFGRIMQAVASLAEGQELLIIAPFKPEPIFAVLAQQGFGHLARETESGDWEVRFSKEHAPKPKARKGPPAGAERTVQVVDVDARGLEPPQPLVKILEALAGLPAGAALHARTDRRPMHLHAELESRGFTGESVEQPDGSFVTHIPYAAR
jgi:uncharacterized protein (DUF2249 family)